MNDDPGDRRADTSPATTPGGGGDPFEIPYADIVSVRLLPYPSPISLMKVLNITYRDAQGVHEKSIAAYTSRAEQAFAILQHYAPARRTADRH